jgi:hypothetical protein
MFLFVNIKHFNIIIADRRLLIIFLAEFKRIAEIGSGETKSTYGKRKSSL